MHKDEQLPLQADGSIDKQRWLKRHTKAYQDSERDTIAQAVELALGKALQVPTELYESCVHQGLVMAQILTAIKVDLATLCAAILYPAFHHKQITSTDIAHAISQDTADLTIGLSKMDAIYHISHQVDSLPSRERADNLRRMLLAVVEDIRVVLLRLAERTSVMRLAAKLESNECTYIAHESQDIYAPLANRFGLGQMKWELEDLAFRYLEPEKYKKIAKWLDERRVDREVYIDRVVSLLQEKLRIESVPGKVFGRVKHIFSIWRKLKNKNLNLDDLYDIRAVRILVPEIRDCYAVLGMVHSIWQHIPREFDDYIATPKENGYRSLHTAVIGPEGKTLEVQIRTFDMHQESEYGVSAHWRYKEGGRGDPRYERKIASMRQLLELHNEGDESFDTDVLHTEIFADRVYVYTPRGDVIDLPENATGIDFAYHIHTDIGHRCRGVKINGEIASLNQPLKTGDQVSILTAKEGCPSRDWLTPSLGFVRSARARSKIQAWFRQQDRSQNITMGRDLIERELKRLNIRNLDYTKLTEKLQYDDKDALFAALGRGDIRLGQILGAVQAIENPLSEKEAPENLRIVSSPSGKVTPFRSEVMVEGVGNLLSYVAKCCKPVPGDAIVGFVTHGRGVAIHREDCINLLHAKTMDDGRIIQVAWGAHVSHLYPTEILVKAVDRQGLLRDITLVLTSQKIKVTDMSSRINHSENTVDLKLHVEVTGLDELSSVLGKIYQLDNIIEVCRSV